MQRASTKNPLENLNSQHRDKYHKGEPLAKAVDDLLNLFDHLYRKKIAAIELFNSVSCGDVICPEKLVAVDLLKIRCAETEEVNREISDDRIIYKLKKRLMMKRNVPF